MSTTQQYQVLEFISEKIKKAIADAVLQNPSESVAIVKDGNDSIKMEQLAGDAPNTTSIFITDNRNILYSEDLLTTLQDIHEGTESKPALYAALKETSIVVNGLSIETEFVFQGVKDCFDTLSSSYEFVKIIEKNINALTIAFVFGDTKFTVAVANEPELITVSAEIANATDAKVKKTIDGDVVKVQSALNKIFKENK